MVFPCVASRFVRHSHCAGPQEPREWPEGGFRRPRDQSQGTRETPEAVSDHPFAGIERLAGRRFHPAGDQKPHLRRSQVFQLPSHLPGFLAERWVEGLIGVDPPYDQPLPLPVVCISGHLRTPGVTRIVLNHTMAAELALRHLKELGHRDIAFIRGQDFSSDTKVRWDSIRAVARRMDLCVTRALVAQLGGDSPSPETGYIAARQLLASGKPFTALFAFNDVSAIGAIRALQEAGRRVPENVAVVGFDNIPSGAFHIPALTTICQPLPRMGALAAEVLLKRIAEPDAPCPEEFEVEPELIVRESTCAAPVQARRRRTPA